MKLTFPSFDTSELEQVRVCLDSGWATQGPFVQRLEELVAVRQGTPYAYAVTSCTAALHLAALALGLGPGDEVVVPAFTWITSANCVEYTGAKAVFADVDPATFNIDPAALENAITSKTKAVVVVHLFGLPAEMDPILSIARAHGLAIIEDCACAIGSSYNGRPVGGLGDVGCFSFHPRKIVTTGEGGMATTNREDLGKTIWSLRSHGGSARSPEDGAVGPWSMDAFEMLGFNYRLSDILAAVGVAQMAKLDDLLQHRQACAARYDTLLAATPVLAAPVVPEGSVHTYQSYVIRVLEGGRERRNRIMQHLADAGIQTRPGTHAVHRLGYYRKKYNLRPEDFPNACVCEDVTITLPLFPGMTAMDQELVVATLLDSLG